MHIMLPFVEPYGFMNSGTMKMAGPITETEELPPLKRESNRSWWKKQLLIIFWKRSPMIVALEVNDFWFCEEFDTSLTSHF
jgi:hypothetical protein